jgi:hypothetical protein
MRRLGKFWSLTRREKHLLCEAIILLSISTICVKAIAFRRIDRFMRTHWNDRVQRCTDREQEISLVQRSISRAANVLPWRSLCLSRSLAEFMMLRRRGIPATMIAGVRFLGHSSLDAHAWVDTDLEADGQSTKGSDFVTLIRIGTSAVDR